MTNLLHIIEENHKTTGGKCGITMVHLCEKAGKGYPTLKPLLKELHNEGKIKVREGINQKLIFINTNAN